MGSKIKTLKITNFLSIAPTRVKTIEKEKAVPLPQKDSYTANRIANALHPEVQHLVISDIIDRGENAKSFVFAPDKENGTDALAYFSAGQYITISLTVGKAVLSRPYSLSSSPKDSLNGRYEITVKRAEGGLASNFMLDQWKIGDKVEASAPLGDFTYESLRDGKTVIALAGGSGITPFVSLAKAISDGDEDCNLIILYGTKNKKEILFESKLSKLAKECDRIKVVNVLSDEDAKDCEKGFITADLIKKYAPEGDYSLFICGPQGMYEFLKKEIISLGLRPKFVRNEVFGEYRNPQKDEGYPDGVKESVTIKIRLDGKDYQITANPNDTILSAVEKGGVPAPAHCRSGICGWCHARLLSGEVYIPKSVDGRRMADSEFGYIHPCCTFATSDIEIEI